MDCVSALIKRVEVLRQQERQAINSGQPSVKTNRVCSFLQFMMLDPSAGYRI
jgi:hypothetical protein